MTKSTELRIWSHLLKNSLMENFVFHSVQFHLRISVSWNSLHEYFRTGTRFFLKWVSLTNKQNLWQIPEKVFHSCPKHIPSTENTSQTPSSMFTHQLALQTNINRFNLFGSIVVFMYILSCINKSHKTIDSQSKSSTFYINDKNRDMTP